MKKHEKSITMALLGVAMFSQMFLFSVAYTNASFNGEEYTMRDYFAPSQVISQSFDQKLSVIADNLNWSVTVALQQSKGPVLAFLGLDGYKYGEPRYTSLASASSFDQPQVLGAYQVNPDYNQNQ